MPSQIHYLGEVCWYWLPSQRSACIVKCLTRDSKIDQNRSHDRNAHGLWTNVHMALWHSSETHRSHGNNPLNWLYMSHQPTTFSNKFQSTRCQGHMLYLCPCMQVTECDWQNKCWCDASVTCSSSSILRRKKHAMLDKKNRTSKDRGLIRTQDLQEWNNKRSG